MNGIKYYIFTALILSLVFPVSCISDNGGVISQKGTPGGNVSTEDDLIIGGMSVRGVTEIVDSTPALDFGGEDLSFTTELVKKFKVDNFFEVRGHCGAENPYIVGKLKIERDSEGNITKKTNVGSYLPKGKGDFHLRYFFPHGPGEYQFTIQTSKTIYRFTVINEPVYDLQFLRPTTEVQFLNPQIVAEAEKLATKSKDDMDLIRWIHAFVANRTTHVHETIHHGQDAVTVLNRRTAVCGGFSNLFAAMARSQGFRTAIVTGFMQPSTVQGRVAHAWCRVEVEGTWYYLEPQQVGHISETPIYHDWKIEPRM